MAKLKNIKTNWDEKSDAQKAIGFLAICAIVLFFVLSYLHTEKEISYIHEHGVWTILTVTNKKVSWRGYRVYYYFQYKNKIYRDMEIMTDLEAKSGNRFFVIIVPKEEARYLISDAVPDWFTLSPPQEGWKTRPSERKMRRMMEQDSIRRGLKEEVQRE